MNLIGSLAFMILPVPRPIFRGNPATSTIPKLNVPSPSHRRVSVLFAKSINRPSNENDFNIIRYPDGTTNIEPVQPPVNVVKRDEIEKWVKESGVQLPEKGEMTNQFEMGAKDKRLNGVVVKASSWQVHYTIVPDSSKLDQTGLDQFFDNFSHKILSSNRPNLIQVLKRCMDPFFGVTKGNDPPPRYVLIYEFEVDRDEVFDKSVEHMVEMLESNKTSMKFKWSAAQFNVIHSFASSPPTHAPYVVSQLITSDWTDISKVNGMGAHLKSYADECVSDQLASKFVVMQAEQEPTVFKTWEHFDSIDKVEEYTMGKDPMFNDDIMKYRAAVNRVRILFEVLDQ